MTLTLTPPQDAAAMLVDPASAGSGDRIWQLRESAGFALGAIDWAVEWLAGFSPLEEWVGKPLGGDWGALDRGSEAWANAGKAVAAIAANVDHLPGALGDVWHGEAARSFDDAQAKVAAALAPLPGACDAMSQLCTALADMAQAITEFVLMIANALAEFIGQMLISLATVAGSVTVPVWVTKLAANLARWIPALSRMIDLFMTMLPKALKIINRIKDVIDKLKPFIQALMKLQQTMEPALQQVEESTRAVETATSVPADGSRSGGGGGGGGR